MTDRARRAWLRRLAAAAAAALAATVYLDRVFVPARLKGCVEDGVAAALHRRARIGQIHYTPFRGVWMRDAVVFDADGATVLLSVPKVSLTISWPALLRRGQVVISALRLHGPELRLRYRPADGLNLPGLSLDSAPSAGSGPSLLRLEVDDGTVRFAEERAGEFVATGLRARARGEAGGGYVVEASGRLGSSGAQGRFTLAGRLDARGRLRADLRMEELPAAAAAGLVRLQPLALSARRIGPVSAEVSLADGKFRTALKAEVAGLRARDARFEFLGDAGVSSVIVTPLSDGETTHATRLSLRQAKLELSVPPLAAESIAGDVVLTQDGVSAEDLRLALVGIPLRLRARMDGWTDPVFDIEAAGERVELQRLLRAGSQESADLRVSGAASFRAHLRGRAAGLLASLHGGMAFDGATLESRFLAAPLRRLRGGVEFSAEAARWKGVAFNYQGLACRTSGLARGFREPKIEASVASASPRARFDLAARLQSGRWRISRLSGAGPSTRLDLSGWVDAPAFDLSGKIRTSWSDVSFLLPERLLRPVARIGLAGAVTLEGSAAGPLDSPSDWQVSLRAAAEDFAAWGLRLDSLSFDLEQKERRLRLSSFTASGYGGTLAGKTSLDFAAGPAAHETTLVVKDLDLERLRDIPRLKSKQLNGRLSLDGQVRGPLRDLWELSGKVALKLRQGRLLRFPLLGQLGDILFGKEHNNTVFSEAEGALLLTRGVIQADSVYLFSDQMALSLSGRADPRGPLDITVHTRLNRRILLPSLDIKKYAARVVGNLGILVVVRITGTAAQPQFAVMPTPLSWLESVTGFLTGDE